MFYIGKINYRCLKTGEEVDPTISEIDFIPLIPRNTDFKDVEEYFLVSGTNIN